MNWIAVGLSKDVPPALVMPANVKGTELAIWRSNSGSVHAWGDRCPHRGMRLSHGFVRDDTLACIYHGWQYGKDGACRKIPAHPDLTPPRTICATTYPCAEQGDLIWVALSPDPTMPPATANLQAIRSMQISRSAQAIAAHFGADLSPLITAGDLTFALQPMTDVACMVHGLSAPAMDRHTASRRMEELRKTLEGVPA